MDWSLKVHDLGWERGYRITMTENGETRTILDDVPFNDAHAAVYQIAAERGVIDPEGNINQEGVERIDIVELMMGRN
jgi:hypothetical protein